MRRPWLRIVVVLGTFAALGSAARSAIGDCTPTYDGGSIVLTGGSLNGNAVIPATPRVVVHPGDALTGTVDITVQNNGAPQNVFPVCATPNWGDHATSGWSIASSCPPGACDYTVPVSLTAPETPGTYYLFFVGSWELDCGNVLSCTNWNNGTGDLWDNGHDVADWTPTQAQNAVHLGWVCSDWMAYGTLNQYAIPATALEIQVEAVVPVVPTTWGVIKARYR